MLALLSAACASDPEGPEERLDRRFEEYAQLIDETIDDDVRAQRLKDILQRVNADFDRRVEQLRATDDEMLEAERRYATTEEELAVMMDESRAQISELQNVLANGSEELRDLVSEDEWNDIVNKRRKILGIF